MLSWFPPARELIRIAETLLTAAAGGIGFHLIGFPGGLVAGSMLAVSLAALAGRPMRIPLALARLCFVMVGILLGSVVTPEMLGGIAAWPTSIAVLVVSAIAMFIATAAYLRFVHAWDPLSALLGASPGSMAQVMALSAELGADVRGIAIVHVMRVLLIVLGLPAGLALLGSTVEPRLSVPGAAAASPVEFAILVTVSTSPRLPFFESVFPAACCSGRSLVPHCSTAPVGSLLRCRGGPAPPPRSRLARSRVPDLPIPVRARCCAIWAPRWARSRWRLASPCHARCWW